MKREILDTYRQGDVLIVKVSDFTEKNLRATKSRTAALGEVSGHHHTFTPQSDVKCMVGPNPTIQNGQELLNYVEVGPQGATITHQEHDAIQLDAGKYEVSIQVEHFPEEIRNVAD